MRVRLMKFLGRFLVFFPFLTHHLRFLGTAVQQDFESSWDRVTCKAADFVFRTAQI